MAVRQMLRQNTLYPGPEMLLLVLAALDVMLTHTVLYLGGVEANPLAARVIERGGTLGMSIYKFSLIALFVLIVEFIGARRIESGRRLASAGLAISVVPIVVAFMLMPALVGEYVAGPSARNLDAARPQERLEPVTEDEVVLREFQA